MATSGAAMGVDDEVWLEAFADRDEGSPARDTLPTVAPALGPSRLSRVAGAVLVGFGLCLTLASQLGLGRSLVEELAFRSLFHEALVTKAWPEAFADASGVRHSILTVSGPLSPLAGWRVRAFLAASRAGPGDVVALSSFGGSVEQSLVIGREIRARGLATVVATFDPEAGYQASECASACVFVFAGGVARSLADGSRLGVHRFSYIQAGRGADDLASAQVTSGRIVDFVADMGVSDRFLGRMVRTGEISWLTPAEAAALDLVTDPKKGPEP